PRCLPRMSNLGHDAALGGIYALKWSRVRARRLRNESGSRAPGRALAKVNQREKPWNLRSARARPGAPPHRRSRTGEPLAAGGRDGGQRPGGGGTVSSAEAGRLPARAERREGRPVTEPSEWGRAVPRGPPASWLTCSESRAQEVIPSSLSRCPDIR